MKKIIFVLLLICASVAVIAEDSPSNYSPLYARFTNEGPVLFGWFDSAVMSPRFVIGYKNSGVLANAPYLDVIAIFIYKNYNSNDYQSVTNNFRIDRDPNGRGFLSGDFSQQDLVRFGNKVNNFVAYGYTVIRVELAFVSEGKWDSKYGQNYVFNIDHIEKYPTYSQKISEITSYPLPNDAWSYVAGLMGL